MLEDNCHANRTQVSQPVLQLEKRKLINFLKKRVG
jgi:hypothetical protein